MIRVVIARESAYGGRPKQSKTDCFAAALRALLAMTVIISLSSLANATNKNAGTSGAQFLKIGTGGRPTGMGEAFVGVADDVNTIYYNPAGLAQLKRPELTAMHTQWFLGMNYEFGAIALPTSKGIFGISAATLQTDDLEKRGVDESLQGSFKTLDAVYGLSYARPLTDSLSVGVTGKFIRQEIDSASAGTWAGDVGLFNRFNRIPIDMGLAIRHLGENVQFIDEGDPLPLTIDLGISKKFMRERLLMAFDVKKPRDNDVDFGVGSEWKQRINNDLRVALRLGYDSNKTDAGGANGLAVGGGIGIRRMDIDVSWVPMGDLGNTFRYSLLLRF